MTLTNNKRVTRTRLAGLTTPVGRFEGNANLARSVPLIVDGNGESGGFAYSASAEDKGVAGILDLSPGLIYNGTPGGYVNVEVYNLDAKASVASATTPEATDRVAAAVYINSDLVAKFDEGSVAELDTATAEFNINQQVGPLVPGDVVRVGLKWTGEADADLTLPTAGEVRFT